MGTPDRQTRQSGGRGAALALGGLVRLAHLLPYGARVRLFGWLGRRVIGPILGYRRRCLDNLDHVWPDRPQAERRAIAGAAMDHAGRLLIEHYSMKGLFARMARVTPTGPGLAALARAQAEGRPVLLVTGHFGSYEAARACLIGQGVALGGLYRPAANAHINRAYVAAVARMGGGPLFEQGPAGMKRLLRFLRGGGVAMVLNDLYVGAGPELPFLGRPARTGTALAELALRLDAVVIPFYGIRQPDGIGFAVELEAPIGGADALALTRAMTATVEARILADPGQWFWMHRRWKRKWDQGAGADPSAHPATLPRRFHRRAAAAARPRERSRP